MKGNKFLLSTQILMLATTMVIAVQALAIGLTPPAKNPLDKPKNSLGELASCVQIRTQNCVATTKDNALCNSAIKTEENVSACTIK